MFVRTEYLCWTCPKISKFGELHIETNDPNCHNVGENGQIERVFQVSISKKTIKKLSAHSSEKTQKKFDKVVKGTFYVFRRTFWENTILVVEKYTFLRLNRNFIKTATGFLPQVLWKLNFTKEHFGWKVFLETLQFLLHILGLSAFFLRVLSEISKRCSQYCILRVQKKFSNSIFEKKIVFCYFSADFGQRVFSACVKT